MKDKIEGKDKEVVQRETWMLELPEANAKNFGLGARQFSRKGKTCISIIIVMKKKYKEHIPSSEVKEKKEVMRIKFISIL